MAIIVEGFDDMIKIKDWCKNVKSLLLCCFSNLALLPDGSYLIALQMNDSLAKWALLVNCYEKQNPAMNKRLGVPQSDRQTIVLRKVIK